MSEDKRYQLKQDQLYYLDSTLKPNWYSDLIDTENNDKVICSFDNDSETSKMVDLLNEQDDEIKSLKKDIKILGNHNTEYVRSIYILEDKIKKLKEEKKGLQSKAKILLDFYSKRYGDAVFNGERHSKTLREELWIVKQVLSELGLYEDD